MVLLQPDDHPLLPGYTAGESAIMAFYRPLTDRPLVRVPDNPSLWQAYSTTTVLLDPALHHLALWFPDLDYHGRYYDPTVDHPRLRQDPTRTALLWLTPETAARVTVLRGPDLETAQVVVEGDQIRITVGPRFSLLCNQEVTCTEPCRRLEYHPEWVGPDRPELLAAVEGEQHYYVEVECLDPDELTSTSQRGLPSLFPDRLLREHRGREEYRRTLAPEAQDRLDERWGTCGICHESGHWWHVHDCCQYIVCDGCRKSWDRVDCPHCRTAGTPVLVSESAQTLPTSFHDVIRAILEASPYARILQACWDDDPRWEECRRDPRGGLYCERLQGRPSATHLVYPLPPVVGLPLVTAIGNRPLQVYYVGVGCQSHIRAAAEAGLLCALGQLPVVPVIYRPQPAEVVRAMTRTVSCTSRRLLEWAVLHYTCLHRDDQGWDLDLEVVERQVRGRHYWDDFRLYRDQVSWSEDGATTTDLGLRLRVGGCNLEVRDLWCRLQPDRRQFLGVIEADAADADSDSDEE